MENITNKENVLKGLFYFCFSESQNIKLVSNHTKIRVESFVSGKGTSAKMYFEGEIIFGDIKPIYLELLGLSPLLHEIETGAPLKLTFSQSLPCGIFTLLV